MFGIKPKNNQPQGEVGETKSTEATTNATSNVSDTAKKAEPLTTAKTKVKKPGILSSPFAKKGQAQLATPVIDPATGVIQHPNVETKFKRMRFMEKYSYTGTRTVLIIGGVLFFIIAFYIGFLIVRALLPAPDSDHDGVPDTADKCPGFSDTIDQDHDGIPDNCDPAVTPGDFSDITFNTPALVTSSDKIYDVVFTITDANKTWGVINLKYKVEVLAASGSVLKSQIDTTYVSPASSTTVIVPNVTTSEKAASAKVTLMSGDFAKNVSSQNIALTIKNKTFTPRTSDGTAVFSGVLQNNSNFDLNVVNVTMVVKSANGTIVADNLAKINTVRASENRYFELRFPESVDPSVTYDVVAITNGMDQANLIPKAGSGSQF